MSACCWKYQNYTKMSNNIVYLALLWVRSAFWNSRSLTLMGKCRGQKTLWVREDQINKFLSELNLIFHADLLRCQLECWETWSCHCEVILNYIWKFYADEWHSRGLKKKSVNENLVFKDKKEEPATTVLLACSLGRWREQSWKLLSNTWRTRRWLGVNTTNLQRENHADQQKHRGQKNQM